MSDFENQSLGWDEDVSAESREFVVLPNGTYDFVITGFERGQFNGSAKLPPCNKATITLQITYLDMQVSVKTDLLLCRSLEWKLTSFFKSIGFKAENGRIRMDWTKVTGAKGKARIKIRTYTSQDGDERRINDVDYFIEPQKNENPSSDDNDEDVPF